MKTYYAFWIVIHDHTNPGKVSLLSLNCGEYSTCTNHKPSFDFIVM